jgi:hypothetical protein
MSCSVNSAQFPAKPVRIIIGVRLEDYPITLLGRSAARLKTWGQPVLVENRVGASDIVAAETVSNHP